jgi:hypothetical protein
MEVTPDMIEPHDHDTAVYAVLKISAQLQTFVVGLWGVALGLSMVLFSEKRMSSPGFSTLRQVSGWFGLPVNTFWGTVFLVLGVLVITCMQRPRLCVVALGLLGTWSALLAIGVADAATKSKLAGLTGVPTYVALAVMCAGRAASIWSVGQERKK